MCCPGLYGNPALKAGPDQGQGFEELKYTLGWGRETSKEEGHKKLDTTLASEDCHCLEEHIKIRMTADRVCGFVCFRAC
jgi:hypothetical protein